MNCSIACPPPSVAVPATRTSSRRFAPLRRRCEPERRLPGRAGNAVDMSDAKGKFVGRSVTRLEDRPLLLGQGRFAADVSFPGQLHMRLVRSTHANARLVSIDT